MSSGAAPGPRVALLALALAFVGCVPEVGSGAPPTSGGNWQTLEPGLELGSFPVAADRPAGGRIHVVRIDTRRFALRVLNASAGDGILRSARDWSAREQLVAAINASMYQQDYSTSVSLMKTAEHVNNAHVTRHKAILAFDPVDPDDPPVKMIDLECERYADWNERYASQIQSIRMVSCNGENVWSPGDQRWSTAAIGLDATGRVLLVHVGTPVQPHAFVDRLLSLPVALRQLMYVEGGPQAQLYVGSGDTRLELVGRMSAMPQAAGGGWPLPNVIGVVRRDDDG